MPSFRRILLLLVLALVPAALLAADAGRDDDIAVRVDRRGSLFIIDVDVPLDATAEEAWATISDYDRMADFVSNITYSKVISRNDNSLRVEQKGRASHGIFSVSFENVRDVELVPPIEIRTKLVSGNLEHAESLTTLVQRNGRLHLVNHGEYVPSIWVPLFIGRHIIEGAAREQFGEMRAEIMRRKAKVASGR